MRDPICDTELERLTTLTRAQLDAARADEATLVALLEHSRDERLELCELADLALDRGDEETARHHEQEAAAWRETGRLLAVRLAARRAAPGRSAGAA